MLEQQIEKLTERVAAVETEQSRTNELLAAVETKQDRTNELLAGILAAIRDDGHLPPAPAKSVPVRQDTATVAVAANDDVCDEPKKIAIVATTTDTPIALEDIQETLMAARDRHGKEAAIEIVERFADGARKAGAIPENRYPDVLAACEALNQVEAA